MSCDRCAVCDSHVYYVGGSNAGLMGIISLVFCCFLRHVLCQPRNATFYLSPSASIPLSLFMFSKGAGKPWAITQAGLFGTGACFVTSRWRCGSSSCACLFRVDSVWRSSELLNCASAGCTIAPEATLTSWALKFSCVK